MKVRGLTLQSLSRLLFNKRLSRPASPRSVFICITDHFEPDWGGASERLRIKRVDRWVDQYPRSVESIEDSLGRKPQHTFFYPLEEYRAHLIDKIASLCHQGFGDVEVHLHHHDDCSENLKEQLIWFKELLFYRHNLLRRDASGEIRYGFIHGNWALCNSRPDGKWCGVNDEIKILLETGCYADFTLPSAPDPTQTKSINRIYYAFSNHKSPKSHDWGPAAKLETESPKDGLLMVPGPLALDFTHRKWKLLPRLENGDLHHHRPPSIERLKLWEEANITVEGRPDWVFCKLHTHGAKESNSEQLLGDNMKFFHKALAQKATNDPEFKYYYVTAYEMAQLVHAAESGETNPESLLLQYSKNKFNSKANV